MKKNLLLISLLSLIAAPVFADDKPPAKQTETAKDESGWYTDYAEAQKAARKAKKPIIMLFTGSDWCGWCIKLERQILSKDEFKTWSEKKAVLFKADFPKKKKPAAEIARQNETLAQKFGIQGYPSVIVTDAHGKVLGNTGYQDMTPDKYTAHLDEIIAGKSKKKSAHK